MSSGQAQETHAVPPPLPPMESKAPARQAPLEETDFLLIRQAAFRRKAVKNAARTASASAATTLVIVFAAVPLLIFWPSWSGVMVVAGLSVIGAVEFRFSRRMRRADPAAARVLGFNQLALLGLIALYCVIQMALFSPEQAKDAAFSPEVRSQLASVPGMEQDIYGLIERWAPLMIYGFYGLIIVLSVFFQGGMALYYFTRKHHLEAFNKQTPPWIRRLFIETGA